MARVLAWLLLFALLVLPPAPFAHAQDGKKKNKGGGAEAAQEEEKAPPEKTAEQKELEAIGAEFKAMDADALMARVPEKGKIRLALGPNDRTFNHSHAKTVIEGWFESRTIVKVKLKPSKDTKTLTGTFTLKYRRLKKPKPVVKDLVIRIKRKDTEFILHSIRVQSQ